MENIFKALKLKQTSVVKNYLTTECWSYFTKLIINIYWKQYHYLLSDDRDVLKDAGKISHEIAKEKALTEFEKYIVVQDKLYKSYFDKLIESSEN